MEKIELGRKQVKTKTKKVNDARKRSVLNEVYFSDEFNISENESVDLEAGENQVEEDDKKELRANFCSEELAVSVDPVEVSLRKKAQMEAEETFRLFDMDDDGLIKAAELCAAMKAMRLHISVEEAEDMIDIFDEQGMGGITMHQFSNIFRDEMRSEISETELEYVFQSMDADKDGLLSIQDIQSTLRTNTGMALNKEEVQKMMHVFTDRDCALINYKEYLQACSRHFKDYSGLKNPPNKIVDRFRKRAFSKLQNKKREPSPTAEPKN